MEKGGRLPVNPSGGLKSKGHPVGATGVSMHVMASLQLMGEAEGMQVDGRRARRHLQHGRRGGGELRVDPGAAAVAAHKLYCHTLILGRAIGRTAIWRPEMVVCLSPRRLRFLGKLPVDGSLLLLGRPRV